MMLAERFPTFARHWQVLRAAWAIENAADAARRPVSDPEFLPAALEIMESPPSPGLRMLMLLLCGLFAVAILWSCFGRLDVVAVASGRIVPAGNVKLIQPIEIGVVRAIHVRDGQHVTRGQLLIELDPTISGAEEAQATQGLLAARVIGARNTALLAHLAGRASTFVAPPGTPKETVAVQRQFIAADVATYEAKRAGLIEQRAGANAELASATAAIAKLIETLPLIDQQLEARRELTGRGHYPKLKLLEYEQFRIEHLRDTDVQKAIASKARAAIANIDAQLAELKQTFAREAVGDLSKAGDDASLRVEELHKSAQRKVLQQLRSPVDGVVQQLAIHTIGGVVQPAQSLMVVVPSNISLEVEALILNRDIGFIRNGQKVRVKLEAFPFTDYGLIGGSVMNISRDAINDEKLGLVYAARVRLDSRVMHLPSGDVPLSPGMAVQAEIRTGERRIIQYLLSPIAKSIDEAGRER
jgi:hemolysin D